MRMFDSPSAGYFAAEPGMDSRIFLWIVGRDRGTGAPASIGFWTGDDHQVFTVEGETRTYYGAGGLIGIEPITYEAGLVVRMQTVHVSAIAPEIAQALRGYEPRLALVEIHRGLFYTASGNLVSAPHRMFRGEIDSVQFTTPEEGGVAACQISLASAARALTKGLTVMRSDNALRQRQPGDRLLRYADVSGAVDVFWGEKKAKAKGRKSSDPVRPGLRAGNGEWGN